MQGPTGFSGVQARPNSGHSFGAIAPRRTSPQRHPRVSRVGSTRGSNAFVASWAAYFSEIAMPLAGIDPSPRHTASQGSNTSAMIAWAAGLPSACTPRV